MNLQENIQRIKSMMGLVTENIDDLLDKLNRGEELSQDDKNRMDVYSGHLQSGGTESNYEETMDPVSQESDEVDYDDLLDTTIFDYFNDLFKDSFYVYVTKEVVTAFPGLERVIKRINGEEESDVKDTKLNNYLLVGKNSPEYKDINFCQLAIVKNLSNGDNSIHFHIPGHAINIKRHIKQYVENKASQSVKDLYNNNDGPLYDFMEWNDYQKEDEPRIKKVFLQWVRDKFGEFFQPDEIRINMGNYNHKIFSETIKEVGIDGYVKNL